MTSLAVPWHVLARLSPVGWLVGIGAALALAATAVVRHRRPWRGPRPRYPVVRAHGVMGIGTVAFKETRRELCFRGIVDHLLALGVEVHCPTVPALGSVEARAKVLAPSRRGG